MREIQSPGPGGCQDFVLPPRGEKREKSHFPFVPFPPGTYLGDTFLSAFPSLVCPWDPARGKCFVFCMRGAHACCHILAPRQRSALLQVHDTTRATSARGGAARNAEYAGLLLIASGILVFLTNVRQPQHPPAHRVHA